MTGYEHLLILEDVYLEDSYVLGIYERGDIIAFDMELVLRETHPLYAVPSLDRQYCYHRGILEFLNVKAAHWIEKNFVNNISSDNSSDFGNIDSFLFEGSKYNLSGDWGEVFINASKINLIYN